MGGNPSYFYIFLIVFIFFHSALLRVPADLGKTQLRIP